MRFEPHLAGPGRRAYFGKLAQRTSAFPLLKALIDRNPPVEPALVEDVIWGVTNQMKEQGGTLGRMISMLADLGMGGSGLFG